MIEVAIVLNHLDVVFDNIVRQCCQSLYLNVGEKECQVLEEERGTNTNELCLVTLTGTLMSLLNTPL